MTDFFRASCWRHAAQSREATQGQGSSLRCDEAHWRVTKTLGPRIVGPLQASDEFLESAGSSVGYSGWLYEWRGTGLKGSGWRGARVSGDVAPGQPAFAPADLFELQLYDYSIGNIARDAWRTRAGASSGSSGCVTAWCPVTAPSLSSVASTGRHWARPAATLSRSATLSACSAGRPWPSMAPSSMPASAMLVSLPKAAWKPTSSRSSARSTVTSTRGAGSRRHATPGAASLFAVVLPPGASL